VKQRLDLFTQVCEGVQHAHQKAIIHRDELLAFPRSKYDDQADSISQALNWIKEKETGHYCGLIEFWKQEAERMKSDPNYGRPTRYDALDELRNSYSSFPIFRRW